MIITDTTGWCEMNEALRRYLRRRYPLFRSKNSKYCPEADPPRIYFTYKNEKVVLKYIDGEWQENVL